VYLDTLECVGEVADFEPSRKTFGGRVKKAELSDSARYVARLESRAKSAIAARLNFLMAERCLSARMLSTRSHVAINTVYGTIAGDTVPRLGNLVALAAGLGVSLDQLLGSSPVEELVLSATPPGRPADPHSLTVGELA
jgi:hypothetical protein